MEIRPAKSTPSFEWKAQDLRADFPLIFPGSTDAIPFSMWTNRGVTRELNDPEKRALLAGSAYIVISGAITYSDSFGKHWTSFCWWRGYAEADFRTQSCVDYNAVGEGEPPQQQRANK